MGVVVVATAFQTIVHQITLKVFKEFQKIPPNISNINYIKNMNNK